MTEYLWVFGVLYWPCMFSDTGLAKGFINLMTVSVRVYSIGSLHLHRYGFL
jgi:hypothetical protein